MIGLFIGSVGTKNADFNQKGYTRCIKNYFFSILHFIDLSLFR